MAEHAESEKWERPARIEEVGAGYRRVTLEREVRVPGKTSWLRRALRIPPRPAAVLQLRFSIHVKGSALFSTATLDVAPAPHVVASHKR